MAFALLIALLFHTVLSIFSSVHIERIGSTSVSKNCDSKPCFQGRCENDKCRCFAGWGGQQCDRCYGRNFDTTQSNLRLIDENEVLTDGPRNYSSSSRCMWIITGEKHRGALLMRVESFVTECSWDHLYIYDGNGVYGPQLAALSGVMSGTEISVRSGRAVVYFFSDLAFNMSGFNITFAYGKCPNNCTSNGRCVSGLCECFDGYTGPQCGIRICTEKEREQKSKACSLAGVCNAEGKCTCNKDHHGDHCQAFSTVAIFEELLSTGNFTGRASHASVIVSDTKIWVISGAHFSGVNSSFVTVYDIANRSWQSVKTKNTPKERHEHTVVKYKNTLYMFGGVIDEKIITNELWSLNMDTLKWSLETPGLNSPNAVPMAVAGHAAHLIGDEMLIFFGHNPFFGYLYTIQKYKISIKQWMVVKDNGPRMHGRFAHSLVSYMHDKKDVILIYGGYMPPNEGIMSRISSTLLEYVCDSRECSHRTLSSGLTPVFRHSASLINDLMVVVGGSGHNESSSSRVQECYSSEVQVYDIGCDTWFSLSISKSPSLQIYGHTSVASKDNIFLIGGFNGTMLSTVIKFTPAQCGDIKRPDDCRNMREGVRCIFHSGRCKSVQRDVSYVPSFISYIKNEDPKEEQKCPINWRK